MEGGAVILSIANVPNKKKYQTKLNSMTYSTRSLHICMIMYLYSHGCIHIFLWYNMELHRHLYLYDVYQSRIKEILYKEI